MAALAPAAELEAELATVRDDITGKRAALAEVRAEQQAIVREAELADRRLDALEADKRRLAARSKARRPDRDARTADRRSPPARADLENAPQAFAEKRDA